MTVFTPTSNSSIVSPNNSSIRIALSSNAVCRKAISVIRQGGTGTPAVFMKFGDGSVSASSTDSFLVIPSAGMERIAVGVPFGVTHVAFFSTGAPDINVTEGEIF